MKKRGKATLSGLVALLFSVMRPTAHAGQSLPCWIQQVEERGAKLYIYFLAPNYRQRAFVSTRSKERQDETSSNTNYLLMREGEKASISDGLHSGCSITVERQERQLGLEIEAYVTLPNLPAHKTTEFIPAMTYDELQQTK